MANRGVTRIVPTTCRIEDGMDCRILAHVENGKVVKIEPGEFPTPGMRHICAKGLSSVKDILYHPDRTFIGTQVEREPRNSQEIGGVRFQILENVVGEKIIQFSTGINRHVIAIHSNAVNHFKTFMMLF